MLFFVLFCIASAVVWFIDSRIAFWLKVVVISLHILLVLLVVKDARQKLEFQRRFNAGRPICNWPVTVSGVGNRMIKRVRPEWHCRRKWLILGVYFSSPEGAARAHPLEYEMVHNDTSPVGLDISANQHVVSAQYNRS
jgi:hypothetical protein